MTDKILKTKPAVLKIIQNNPSDQHLVYIRIYKTCMEWNTKYCFLKNMPNRNSIYFEY